MSVGVTRRRESLLTVVVEDPLGHVLHEYGPEELSVVDVRTASRQTIGQAEGRIDR
jgi:hypothetical protein